MSKLSLPLFLINIVFLAVGVPHANAQFQTEPPAQETEQAQSTAHSESALRRFEIVTLSSLPFTAIHSYVVVRGIKMYRANKFSPELSPRDYRIIGIGAASLSLFIGLWDWWHTRNVDRSAPRIPEPQAPPPPEEEEPTDGTIARLPTSIPYAARYRNMSLQASFDNQLNRWANEPAAGVSVPLIQIRF